MLPLQKGRWRKYMLLNLHLCLSAHQIFLQTQVDVSAKIISNNDSSTNYGHHHLRQFLERNLTLDSEWVSERLLLNAKWEIFQLQYISWQEHVTFHEMMMSTLYWYNMLSLNFIMLAHWNDSPLVDMSPPLGHIILISRQPVFAMLLYSFMLCI